jgi:hypothetical protein
MRCLTTSELDQVEEQGAKIVRSVVIYDNQVVGSEVSASIFKVAKRWFTLRGEHHVFTEESLSDS